VATIADLEVNVQRRLEEAEDDIGIFWLVAPELRPLIVEAMNIATLITGDPQVLSNSLAATLTIPSGGAFLPVALPSGVVVVTRMTLPSGAPLQKVWIQDLDRNYPGWEIVTAATPQFWFPVGLGKVGVYPTPTAPINLGYSYVTAPVTTGRPYSGTETIPFQSEFNDAFQDYAAGIARFKEAGPEFQQAFALLNRFMTQMTDMSNFAYRKGSLRFSRSTGGTAGISEVRGR
jgi:hypothetical protein